MKKKGLGFYFAAIAAILTIVTLVMMFLYSSRGGVVQTNVYVALGAALICEASLLLGEKPWSDFAGIIAGVLTAYAMVTVVGDGLWNIAESINGIRMIGIPELAGMNYTLVGLGVASILFTIFASFSRKEKKA